MSNTKTVKTLKRAIEISHRSIDTIQDEIEALEERIYQLKSQKISHQQRLIQLHLNLNELGESYEEEDSQNIWEEEEEILTRDTFKTKCCLVTFGQSNLDQVMKRSEAFKHKCPFCAQSRMKFEDLMIIKQ